MLHYPLIISIRLSCQDFHCGEVDVQIHRFFYHRMLYRQLIWLVNHLSCSAGVETVCLIVFIASSISILFVYTVHPISFEPRPSKLILVAPSSQNFGCSFPNPSNLCIPNKSIGSYAALYHDQLSMYVVCRVLVLYFNLKWRKMLSNVSR